MLGIRGFCWLGPSTASDMTSRILWFYMCGIIIRKRKRIDWAIAIIKIRVHQLAVQYGWYTENLYTISRLILVIFAQRKSLHSFALWDVRFAAVKAFWCMSSIMLCIFGGFLLLLFAGVVSVALGFDILFIRIFCEHERKQIDLRAMKIYDFFNVIKNRGEWGWQNRNWQWMIGIIFV